MPYTDPWNTTDPAGSVAANTIDTEIQKLRLQLQERVFAALFDTPYTADPLVLKDDILGSTTKTIIIGAYGGNSHEDEDDLTAEEGYLSIDQNEPYRQKIIMPVGVTITQVECLVDKQLQTSVAFDLFRGTFTTSPAASSVASGSTSSAGAVIITDSALSILVGANDWFYIKVLSSGSASFTRSRFYGTRITYTVPDSRNTY